MVETSCHDPPQWLQSPAAVFYSDTVPGALVAIGPELVEGNPVRITLEPNGTQNTLDVHLLTNAYDAVGKTPWLHWAHEGLARYVDRKTFPAILAPSGLQLPKVEQIMRGTGKILTERNLAGYRKENPPVLRRAPTGAVMSPAQAKDLYHETLKGMENAPPVVVVQTPADFPFAAPSNAKGVFYKGSVYLVSSNIEGAVDGRNTIVHEVIGHFGLRGFFGKGLGAVLVGIHRDNASVQKAAYQWKRDNADMIAQWKADYGVSDQWVHERTWLATGKSSKHA